MAYTATPKPPVFVTVGIVVTNIYTAVVRTVASWTKVVKP